MNNETIYWVIVIITFLFIVFKNYKSDIKLLIILCFYSGLASYLGKGTENIYKVILVLYSVYCLIKYDGLSEIKRNISILLFLFVLFSISFLYSAFINNDYPRLIFSQYGKYVTPVCCFLIFNRAMIYSPTTLNNLKDLLLSLIIIQIILSVIKIITLGLIESTVGSIAYLGGGAAAIIPVLGFILFWLHKKGEINTKDWIYVFMLLIIGIASLKRAIWFITPAIIFLFMYYVPKKATGLKLIYILPIILMIFYAGVRLNPTLNREHRIGGSFDLKYALNYAQEYTFGNNSEYGEPDVGTGRGSATLLILKKLFDNKSLSFNDFLGYGLQQVYTVDYEKFNEEKFGVISKGALTGIFQTYITAGYVGVILTVLLLFSAISLIREKRIRVIITLFVFWDYFFYSGLLLRIQALSVLFFFIIIYSNFQYQEGLYDRYLLLKSAVRNK